MPLKYLILVLLLMDFFHTFILSEKTRFGYPFVVPYLVFFVGVFCNAPLSRVQRQRLCQIVKAEP